MSVTLGVSLAKKGMSTTALTHRQMFRTSSGSCPQASPIPLSPIPWGQDRLSSRASAPALCGCRAGGGATQIDLHNIHHVRVLDTCEHNAYSAVYPLTAAILHSTVQSSLE